MGAPKESIEAFDVLCPWVAGEPKGAFESCLNFHFLMVFVTVACMAQINKAPWIIYQPVEQCALTSVWLHLCPKIAIVVKLRFAPKMHSERPITKNRCFARKDTAMKTRKAMRQTEAFLMSSCKLEGCTINLVSTNSCPETLAAS